MTSNRISRQVCHLEPFGKYIPPRLKENCAELYKQANKHFIPKETAAISDRVLASEHRRTSTSSVLCAASAELSSSVIDALLNFYASGNDRSDAFGFVPRRSSKRVVVFCHHPVVAIRNGGVGYVEIDFIRQRKKEIIVICENS
ncbi:hypothetical protein T4C_10901 [Trichinella pseudospiralis]|uniref:Uncharacterized protein n=1 Tax=Trichinella pseudospiralis TaxID=6337 RepID=A0A0V1JK04_TRIPS|nr:hypothetical protein T4C_10901 [Trichinella pseudospiralis]